MKETGIMMSGNHPTLILKNLQTMTRRTRGLNQINKSPDSWHCLGLEYTPDGYKWHFENSEECDTLFIRCPYGQVGDTLWVRETHVCGPGPVGNPTPWVVYRANGGPCDDQIRWKPSIFMPKWAARIFLEITGVRVERVQDISRGDIRAEGVRLPVSPRFTPNSLSELHQEFRSLWDSINSKREYSWESNPRVWVISFKPIPQEG